MLAGAEMAAEGDQMSAEKVEEDVMDELPTLTGSQLLELCEMVEVEVKEEFKGKKTKLLKLLLKHLCTEGEGEDDKMEKWLMIHSHLNPEPDSDEDAEKVEDAAPANAALTNAASTNAVKVEPVTANSDTSSSKNDAAKLRRNAGKKDASAENAVRKQDVQISRVRMKDFKLSGMIGGVGENALSFSSLEFEIARARSMGHSESEICGVVISKVADKEMKQLFETDPEIQLDDVLDMLRSSSVEARDSSGVFTQFTDDCQSEDELPKTFISRLYRLRSQIVKLGKQEGISYDPDMLAKRGFAVMFSGLRDENVRSALRDKCKDNYKIECKVVLKHCADIVALEKERKIKLFGKGKLQSKAVNVSKVDADDGDEMVENNPRKKEKLNPFTKIEELRAENITLRNDMTAQLNEIRNLMVENNRQNNNNQQQQSRRRPYKKCAQCTTDNKNTCSHCWGCGSGDHKKGDCPGN